MNKIDDYLFGFFTKVTRWYISKRKFKYHKYDFLILLKKIEIVLWIIYMANIMRKAMAQGDHSWFGVALAVTVVMIVVEIWFMRQLKEMKEAYDWLFMMRKHPTVHHTIKEMLEDHYENNRSDRKFILWLDLFMFIWFAVIAPWMLPIVLFSLYKNYVHYIFDFDEPDNHQEAKRDLTEIAAAAFRNLVGAARPSMV